MAAANAIAQRARVQSADARSVVVDVQRWPGHRPGQFAMLRLDAAGTCRDPILPRPMAIFRSETRGAGARLEFQLKVVGRGTALLAALPPGSEIGVLGPLGNGFPDLTGPAVLVGGGTGIASLYELAAAASVRPRVLLGGRSVQDLLGLAAFQDLDVDLELVTEDGSVGHRGLVTERLEAKPDTTVVACGPTGMMRRTAELARAAGARCLVSLESPMACGFGICLGCAIPTQKGISYCCTHGPVFDAAEVRWEGLA